MDPIYLPIDRKNKNFQLVHLDALNGYGIAMKFDFKNKNSFSIVDIKMIKASSSGPIEFDTEITKKFRPSNVSDYGFEINIKINTSGHTDRTLPENDLHRGENFKIATYTNGGKLENQCLIDLHLDNKNIMYPSFFDEIRPLVDWGTEFCRFYIV